MNHLSNQDLLLYAEGELSTRALCLHVQECVDCKARLIDLQETYVIAASAFQHYERPSQTTSNSVLLNQLRKRLAIEAERITTHLSTEDLLMYAEKPLSCERREHLSDCLSCQESAANIHIQLAEIEYRLREEFHFKFPSDRRAAALVALRERLEFEVKNLPVSRKPLRLPVWLQLPSIPVLPAYASGFAAVAIMAWTGWQLVPLLENPIAEPVPQLATLLDAEASSASLAVASSTFVTPASSQSPARFEWTAPVVNQAPQSTLTILEVAPVPLMELAPAPSLFSMQTAGFDLPEYQDPASPTIITAGITTNTFPGNGNIASDPGETQNAATLDALIDGNWLLAKTGLWKEALQVGGTSKQIHFYGNLGSEQSRQQAEKKLLAAAGSQPVSFAITSAGTETAGFAPVQTAVTGPAQTPSGGLVRNSLLRHYADAARRSFQPLESSLLESELDRYVSNILSHDSELLAHVHALNSLLSHPGMNQVAVSKSLQNVVRFHLNGILDHESDIFASLSEALPRRYWTYRAERDKPAATNSRTDESRRLLTEALALDQTLIAMFFNNREALDLRDENFSPGELLTRIRQRARHIRQDLK